MQYRKNLLWKKKTNEGNIEFIIFFANVSDAPNAKTLQTFDKIKLFVKGCVEIMWLFLELHIKKFILLLVVIVSISEVRLIGTLLLWESIYA